MNSTLTAVEHSISKGVDFLHDNQLPYGEFKTYVSPDRNLAGHCVFDSSLTVTTFVLYSTEFVASPKVREMKSKALEFLVEEMEGPGVWRYWTSRNHKHIDPDVDDTSLASYILRQHHPHIFFGSNIALILSHRNDSGLFYTWIRKAGSKNDIDSVVNANVLLYLGERDETKPVCEYLNTIVLADAEEQSCWYYPDYFALYYTMSRAFYRGAVSLGQARHAIVDKIIVRQQSDGSFADDLRTAYAVCALMNYEYHNREIIDRAMHHILDRQQVDGSWPKVAAYMGPEPPGPRTVWWGSEALTTAISLEALARYHARSV